MYGYLYWIVSISVCNIALCDYHQDYTSYSNYYPDYTYNYSAPTYATRQKRIFNEEIDFCKFDNSKTSFPHVNPNFQLLLPPYHLTCPSPWQTWVQLSTFMFHSVLTSPLHQPLTSPTMALADLWTELDLLVTWCTNTWRTMLLRWQDQMVTSVCWEPCVRPVPHLCTMMDSLVDTLNLLNF